MTFIVGAAVQSNLRRNCNGQYWKADMLNATAEEIEHVTEYVQREGPELIVTMAQKVYSENVLQVRHDVWDVHTDKDRWWVITEPMNLYAQDQFPNMDLALTFHIGLCLRIPRDQRPKLSDLPIEPFAEAYRYLGEASDAVTQAEEVADYQAIGVRCREALLAFADAGQTVLPWTSNDPAPKRADLKSWADHICNNALAGASHEYRRRLFKALIDNAWTFTNWLTHAKSTKWHDAEAAVAVTENAISLCTSAVIQYLRGVPDECPACGSHRLSPQRGSHMDAPDVEWERPACDKCGWTGDPIPIGDVPESPDDNKRTPSEGECVIAAVPLRKLRRPSDETD